MGRFYDEASGEWFEVEGVEPDDSPSPEELHEQYKRSGRPHADKIALCKSCQAPIYWALVTKRDGTEGRMPFDVDEPTDHSGSHQLNWNTKRERIWAKYVAPDLRAKAKELGLMLRKSHFSTCPNADEHRSKKG